MCNVVLASIATAGPTVGGQAAVVDVQHRRMLSRHCCLLKCDGCTPHLCTHLLPPISNSSASTPSEAWPRAAASLVGSIPNGFASMQDATELPKRAERSGQGRHSSQDLVTAADWQAATAQPLQAPRWDDITEPLSRAGRAFLHARGIHAAVIAANDLRTASRSFRVGAGWQTLECVAFPYKRDGDVVNVKYRSIQGVRCALCSVVCDSIVLVCQTAWQ